MQPGYCVHRGRDVRISRHLGEGALELTTQPDRWPRDGDVHREVNKARLDFAIAVMTEVEQGHVLAPSRLHRFQNTRAPTHVIAKIAAMP